MQGFQYQPRWRNSAVDLSEASEAWRHLQSPTSGDLALIFKPFSMQLSLNRQIKLNLVQSPRALHPHRSWYFEKPEGRGNLCHVQKKYPGLEGAKLTSALPTSPFLSTNSLFFPSAERIHCERIKLCFLQSFLCIKVKNDPDLLTK